MNDKNKARTEAHAFRGVKSPARKQYELVSDLVV